MKNLSKTYLIIIGLLIMSIGQIVLHFFSIPDMVYGAIVGAGFGILLFAIIFKKLKKTYN
tara:strand:+ start:553 stop:732 length:180 start_codon:yes stop_codon:yes gene_type:complete